MPWHERLDNLAWTPLKNVAEGVRITKLLGVRFDEKAGGASELRWSAAVIEPGGKFGHHAHPHPQCFYFVKGTGEVVTDEGVLPVGPGHLVTLDDLEGHEVRNTGEGELYLMEVSLMHPEAAVPEVRPHPALADEAQPGLALRLHGAVKDAVADATQKEERSAGPEAAATPDRPGASAGGVREAQVPPRTAATWLQAIRPFSMTASVIPVLLGTVLGALSGDAFRPWLGLAALVGAVALHAGSNLVSDYFDYRHGVDRDDTYGSSGVIVGGLLPPQEVFLAGLVTFAVAGVAGVWLTLELGSTVLYLGLAGMVGGYFYSAKPLGLKYRALGDLLIFALFGPLMVLGAWFVQTGQLAWLPLLVAVPVGFLVTAILHANNLRDIAHDSRAGIRTVAMLAGQWGSKAIYVALVVGAYLVVGGLVGAQLLHWTALAVLLSLPLAVRNVRLVVGSTGAAQVAVADVMTAQLHMAFGLLLVVGVALGALL